MKQAGCHKVLAEHICWMRRGGACRVGVQLPEVEVVFKDVSVSAEAFVANRALPSIPNYFLDLAEVSTTLRTIQWEGYDVRADVSFVVLACKDSRRGP